jgi:hypothetical protein
MYRFLVQGLSTVAYYIRFSFPNVSLALFLLAYSILKFTYVSIDATRNMRTGVYFFPDAIPLSEMKVLVFSRACFSRN